jgi:two-component sensor histidine kinase/ligand-binding sensor protein
MPNTPELLDPESWGKVLENYACTVNMAVALVDHEGRIIGKCYNPQPVWSLARAVRPDWGRVCYFCLDANTRCTAAADALRTGDPVIVAGLGGYVHVAAPLFLEGRHLGTLLAGQVFDRFPDMLLVDQVAREFGLSGQKLWAIARRRVPVSHANLAAYGKLLNTLGQAYLRERYSTVLQQTLAARNQELQSSNDDLNSKVVEIAQSNAEKDILLNEVHHRVNNNLQVIASLLRMQATDFPDAQVADALRDSQLRVESMALVHAQLYNSEDWRAVDFAQYAATLTGNLFNAYGIDPARISWKVEIEALKLSVDKAIPAGMIIGELISNALKHAFPQGRHGAVFVGGTCRAGGVELVVQDDGVGVPAIAAPRKVQPLGLKIVAILCRQLKGTLTEPPGTDDAAAGSLFRLSFPYAPGPA